MTGWPGYNNPVSPFFFDDTSKQAVPVVPEKTIGKRIRWSIGSSFDFSEIPEGSNTNGPPAHLLRVMKGQKNENPELGLKFIQ